MLHALPLLAVACASEPGGDLVLRGGTIAGGAVADVEIRDGRVVAVGAVDATGASVVDVSGRWLAPAFVDSHVHLAYRPGAAAMADGGVAGVVDLASPERFLDADVAPLRAVRAGPMVTAIGGYPTRSWGSDGYGVECADADAAAAAAERLIGRGAGVIKVPITPPTLDDAAISAVVAAAHARGRKVATHALGDADAARAAALGLDVLAHTPTERLSDATVAAWSGRAVVSTLVAFGDGDDTRRNLAALRAAGATVLYGTDYGNTSTAGIDARELAALSAAGLDGAAILAAGTSAPAAYWGLADLGAIAPDHAASLLVLDADPLVDPSTLARPERVLIDGRWR